MDEKFSATHTSINNIYKPCWFQSLRGNSTTLFQQNYKRRAEQAGGMSCDDSMGATMLFNDGIIRERLNLGGFLQEWTMCSSAVEARFQSDERASYWIYPILMSAGLRVWVYSGDLDANVPITGTLSWVMKLRE